MDEHAYDYMLLSTISHQRRTVATGRQRSTSGPAAARHDKRVHKFTALPRAAPQHSGGLPNHWPSQ